MSVWSFIIPHIVLRTHSRFNTDILVVRRGRDYDLVIGGSQQSGKYMKGIWEKTFQTFRLQDQTISSILVLGVGGGTAIQLFQSMFPLAHIDAVEIDDKVLTIADAYFHLRESPTLHLIHADARIFLKQSRHVYDLILIDTFSGPEVAPFVQTKGFLNVIDAHTKHGGTIVCNFLRDHGYEGRIEGMRRLIHGSFSSVWEFPIKHNLFFKGKKK